MSTYQRVKNFTALNKEKNLQETNLFCSNFNTHK